MKGKAVSIFTVKRIADILINDSHRIPVAVAFAEMIAYNWDKVYAITL